MPRLRLLLFGIGASLLAGCNSPEAQTPQPTPTEIKTEEVAAPPPVPIVSEVTPEMFPSSWRGGSIQATAEPIAPDEITRTRNALAIAMAKYPASLIQAEINQVYITKSLSFFEIPYGATYTNDAIYVANDGEANGFSDAFLEGSFHHEFSSVLLWNHPGLDETKWATLNPAGFKYTGSGELAIAAGKASLEYDPKLFPDGFLTEYSRSSLEEDFNVIAQELFMGDPRIWAAAKSSSRIRGKVDLVIAFYHGLDPSFTEEYFRAMTTKD